MTERAPYQDAETEYEKKQRFNSLVSWLHTLRYRRILRLFEDLARQEKSHRPIKIIDIDCGPAKLFSTLNERFEIDYTGVEIWPRFVQTAQSRYGHNQNFRIVQESAATALCNLSKADIVIALETFEHIPEHDVVRIIETIVALRPKLLVCSVPIEIGPTIWLKNIGSFVTGYMRHKEYKWIETFWAGLYKLDKLPPHGTGHKGFDWRWLAQTIRHNMKISATWKLPVKIFPAAISFSVFIVAEPRE